MMGTSTLGCVHSLRSARHGTRANTKSMPHSFKRHHVSSANVSASRASLQANLSLALSNHSQCNHIHPTISHATSRISTTTSVGWLAFSSPPALLMSSSSSISPVPTPTSNVHPMFHDPPYPTHWASISSSAPRASQTSPQASPHGMPHIPSNYMDMQRYTYPHPPTTSSTANPVSFRPKRIFLIRHGESVVSICGQNFDYDWKSLSLSCRSQFLWWSRMSP